MEFLKKQEKELYLGQNYQFVPHKTKLALLGQVGIRMDPFDLLDVYKYSETRPNLDHHKKVRFLCQKERNQQRSQEEEQKSKERVRVKEERIFPHM